jgi:CDP-diacylglycerol---serine O-phosphatidyltransferase
MTFEGRFETAVLLVAAAGLIDGIDGRLARALKVQSRFGAELDSLADTVNFGVAPALLLYVWGLGGLKEFGWVAAMVFACCMGLRLARFNAAIDTEKPKWMGNYFTGIPAPAGAVVVLLPFYLDRIGIAAMPSYPGFIALYTLAIAFMLVSTIPTWSGKLLGERISRDMVLPILAGVALVLGLLWAYPYATISALVIGYLAAVPFSWQRFRARASMDQALDAQATPGHLFRPDPAAPVQAPANETKH